MIKIVVILNYKLIRKSRKKENPKKITKTQKNLSKNQIIIIRHLFERTKIVLLFFIIRRKIDKQFHLTIKL